MKPIQLADQSLRALNIRGSNRKTSFIRKALFDLLHVSREHLIDNSPHLSQGGDARSRRAAGGGFRLFMDAKDRPTGRLVRCVGQVDTGQPGGEYRVSHPPISQN